MDDAAGVGTAEPPAARPSPATPPSSARGLAVESAPAVPGGTVGVGDTDRVDGAEGLGVGGADGAAGVVGPLVGAGASGGTGDVGASEAPRRSGSATSSATAHVTPTPAAVRSSRRRDAVRRIAS
ncbi:hypothetical protein [Streptomyces viridochromogenes]|uniref:hypothetical protein n=1 Tax=Streptomyces viridochromogenes TaxID=1938 RepID=UPI0003164EE6|nr:hypothetical protein [Streptomyces viridochromogenes]